LLVPATSVRLQPDLVWRAGIDALTLLKNDHEELKKHLEAGEDTTHRAVKTRAEIFDTVSTLLMAHERIKRSSTRP